MMVNCRNCGRWYDDSFPKCTNCGYSEFGAGGETFYVPPPPPELSAMGGQSRQGGYAPQQSMPLLTNDINAPNYVASMGVPAVIQSPQPPYPNQVTPGMGMPMGSQPVQSPYPNQVTPGMGMPMGSQPVPSPYPNQATPDMPMGNPSMPSVAVNAPSTAKKSKAPLITVLVIVGILLIGGIAAGIYFASRGNQPTDTTSQTTVESSPVPVEESPSESSSGQPAAAGNTR